MNVKIVRSIVIIAMILALFVVMLGAYTRLTDAGLGCPDWPGCYGHMVLPSAKKALESAQNTYPQIPIESRKAWTEMAHRYAAGTLGLLILMISGSLLYLRKKNTKMPWKLPLILITLLFFQAALGMWTVTLKLLPIVVMGHLLGGIILFSCLAYLNMQLSTFVPQNLPKWRFLIGLGLVIVFVQIALGGWVSSNYAGIACIGFPQCNGMWIPNLNFSEGFYLFSPVGANYQGGVLDNEARVTIQFIHRVGAVITALYLLSLGSLLLHAKPNKVLGNLAILAMVLVLVQFILGVMNVIYMLPLGVAVAHNGVAALLLAILAMMFYLTKRRLPYAL